MIENWNFNKSKLTSQELIDYELAEEKIKTWRKFRDSWTEIESIVNEARLLNYYRRFSGHLDD